GALTGEMAEMIVYNVEVNTTQRTIVQNYLSAKYDVALTGTDVYAGDTGANGDYDRGVFGIGQESNTDFHPAAEADGLRFEAGSLSNGNYLLAGYTEPNNTVNTSDIGGVTDLEARMERDWYWDVTNSGSGPNTDVTFDLSEAGFPSVLNPDPSNYVLLYRSGESGDWSEVSSSATVDNGDEITFSDVDAGNFGTGYYTLGTTNQDASPISGTAITIVGTEGNEGEASDGSLGGDAGWRMVGPPVRGAEVEDIDSDVRSPFIFNEITQGDQLYRWDDTIDNGSDPNGAWEVLRDGTDPFDSGRGHILFFFDDDEGPIAPTLTIDIDTGGVPDIPDTDQNVTVNQDARWHLLANPFNQAYDLNELRDESGNAIAGDGTDFQTTVQIWDGGSTSGDRGSTKGSYETVDISTTSNDLAPDGRVISAWQGFFVERDNEGAGDTELTFNANGRTSADRSIVGSNAEGPRSESAQQARIGLALTVEDDDGAQIARDEAASIKWHENATDGWDAFDATKLTPLTSSYATIAPVGETRDGTTALKAQESRPLPDAEEAFTVPLDLETTGDITGTATLHSRAWQGIPAEWEMTLVDTKGTADPSDDEAIAWTEEATYSFTLDADASSSTRASEDATRTQAQKSGLRPPRPEALDAQRPESMLSGYEDDESKTDNADGSTSGASSEAQTSNEDTPPRFVMEVDPQGAPLPVELQELTVQQHDQRALLEWTTASETNNAGFYVETQPLSADSTTTESDWTDLGFVEGTGTTDTPQSYQFETDALDYGAHAFRLRQVDTDGTETATDPVTIEVQLDDAYAIDAPYPNPSNEQATLPVTVQETQRVQVMLYDMLGRRIATVHDGEIRGQDTQAIQLDTGRLASGTYFVRVRGKDFTATERVTVVR
ncbi:MAG: T9SS type A sorting domain-containing protein, partial [Bacteroidota bacterium]